MARPPRDLIKRLTGAPGDYQLGYYRAADLVPADPEVLEVEVLDNEPDPPTLTYALESEVEVLDNEPAPVALGRPHVQVTKAENLGAPVREPLPVELHLRDRGLPEGVYRLDDQTIVYRPTPGAAPPQIVGNGNTVVNAQQVRLTGPKTVSRAYGRGAIAAHEFGGASHHYHGKTRQRGLLARLGGLVTWLFRHPKLTALFVLAGTLACMYVSLH